MAGTAVQPAFTAPVAVSYAPAPTVRYAGFWIRFLAVIIDSIVVGVVTGPLMMILQVAFGLHSGILGALGSDSPDPANLAMFAGLLAMMVTLNVAASAIYEAWLLSSSRQATVGKMVFRIKVTDTSGQRISFARGLGRHFAKYISSMILFIGYIMAAFTERRQALHDMIVGTLVMREIGVPYAIVPPQAPVQ